MRRVIVESPYAGDIRLNLLYLKFCLRDCLLRGEAPFASHGLYIGSLNDELPHERELGITAGYAWRSVAEHSVFYVDLGFSRGMRAAYDSLGGNSYYERRLPAGLVQQIRDATAVCPNPDCASVPELICGVTTRKAIAIAELDKRLRSGAL